MSHYKKIEDFQVIDQLIVGPVILETSRIKCPYKLIINNQNFETELTFKYEENVFDIHSKNHYNLASIIASQVALNYGIFCKKISFIGYFDNHDRRFLREMMENTSREIYIKKMISKNVFFIKEYQDIEFEKREKYTLARTEFQNTIKDDELDWELWETNKNKHCILSSGGKDSLLSFGLINEIGKETYPIFVNESGRHWFTAINAYQYFKNNVPNTGRVWTDTDRLFSWMLKHLSFIRKDFLNVRADDYPIRLWTVAVFIFAVIPLIKKHKLGRIVIGDEYDTTRKLSYNGVRHYDGLFDQSRYFDEYMSRYYLKKGWSVSQFSILRQLSELVIEKILAQRYPHLLVHQVSCHAAHKEGERIKPCGKCEKCRRIVGMLQAMDVNPELAGYTQKAVNESLLLLTKKGVKQLGGDAEHLYYLLQKKGLLINEELIFNAHPATEMLRFENEIAPFKVFPTDIRESLYGIMLQYAKGAIKLEKNKWIVTDIYSESKFYDVYPYEFDPKNEENFSAKQSDNLKMNYLWGELTWQEAEQRLNQIDVAILPVGAIEQHGPHLTLDTDAYDAEYLAKRVAEACSPPKLLVLPLISYGVSYHHDDFKGTISVSNNALSQLVYEIGMSLAKNGIQKLLIINGHGDNSPALHYAAQMINRDAKIFVSIDTGETSDIDIEDIIDTPNDVHAGETETSTSLATRPNLVQMHKAKTEIPNFNNRYLNFSSNRMIGWYSYTKRISDSGILGDPTKATAEKGKRIWEIMIAHLVAYVEELKNISLEQIFQKRY